MSRDLRKDLEIMGWKTEDGWHLDVFLSKVVKYVVFKLVLSFVFINVVFKCSVFKCSTLSF